MDEKDVIIKPNINPIGKQHETLDYCRLLRLDEGHRLLQIGYHKDEIPHIMNRLKLQRQNTFFSSATIFPVSDIKSSIQHLEDF